MRSVRRAEATWMLTLLAIIVQLTSLSARCSSPCPLHKECMGMEMGQRGKFKDVNRFVSRDWNRTTLTIEGSGEYNMYFVVRAPRLQYVSIQHNRKIFLLSIEHCALGTVPRTVSNLPGLYQLIVRFCRLRYLHLGVFRRVPMLSMLDLAHNQITTIFELLPIGAGGRRWLPLKELYLSNNSLYHANMSWFGGLDELVCLHLDGNQLEEISVSVSLPVLEELSLSYNRLRTVDVSHWGYLASLKSVFVDNNRLTSAPIGWNSLIRLEELDLSCNHLRSFRMDDLYLTTVRQLNLTGNALTEVVTSMQQLRVPLEMLRLSHNLLTRLDVSRWDMPNLWLLHVVHNRLTELGDSFTRFPALGNTLNLRQNRWSCRWLETIHPSDLRRRFYGKLSTNESCPDRRHMITELLWICCWDTAYPAGPVPAHR